MDPQASQKWNRGRFTGQCEFLVLEQRSGSENPAAHPASVSRRHLERHFPILCLSFPTCKPALALLAPPACISTRDLTLLAVSTVSPDTYFTLLPCPVCYCSPSAHLIWISSSGVLVTIDSIPNWACKFSVYPMACWYSSCDCTGGITAIRKTQ